MSILPADVEHEDGEEVYKVNRGHLVGGFPAFDAVVLLLEVFQCLVGARGLHLCEVQAHVHDRVPVAIQQSVNIPHLRVVKDCWVGFLVPRSVSLEGHQKPSRFFSAGLDAESPAERRCLWYREAVTLHGTEGHRNLYFAFDLFEQDVSILDRGDDVRHHPGEL